MPLLSRWYHSLVEQGDWETLFRAAMYDEEVYAVVWHASSARDGQLIRQLVQEYLLRAPSLESLDNSFISPLSSSSSSSSSLYHHQHSSSSNNSDDHRTNKNNTDVSSSLSALPGTYLSSCSSSPAVARNTKTLWMSQSPSVSSSQSLPSTRAAAARFFARGLAYRNIHDEVLPHFETLLQRALVLRSGAMGMTMAMDAVNRAALVDECAGWSALLSECGRTPSRLHYREALLTRFTDMYEELISNATTSTSTASEREQEQVSPWTSPALSSSSSGAIGSWSGAVIGAQRSVVRLLAYLCSEASRGDHDGSHTDGDDNGGGRSDARPEVTYKAGGAGGGSSTAAAAITALHHRSNLLAQANAVYLESPDFVSRRFAVRTIALVSGGFDERRRHVYRTEALTHAVSVVLPEFFCYAGTGFLYAYARFSLDAWRYAGAASSQSMKRFQGTPLRRALFSAAVCGGLGVLSHSLVDYAAARRRRVLLDSSLEDCVKSRMMGQDHDHDDDDHLHWRLGMEEQTLRAVRRYQLGSYLAASMLLGSTLLPLQSVTFPRFMGDVCWRFPFVPRLFPALVGLPSRSKCLIPYVLLPTLTVSCSSLMRDKTKASLYDRLVLQ